MSMCACGMKYIVVYAYDLSLDGMCGCPLCVCLCVGGVLGGCRLRRAFIMLIVVMGVVEEGMVEKRR